MQAQAQPYPIRPIRFIVPTPAGGPSDALARSVGQKLAEALGQPIVVDNRPGASGNIGMEAAAKSAPDGYTIVLVGTSFVAINPVLYKLPFDVEKDFQPVAFLARMPNLLIVNKDFPPNNLRELIDLTKANPGKFNYASAGSGNTGHIAAELFKRAADLDIVHVPFAGEPPAMTALIAGRVQMMFVVSGSSVPRIKQGMVKGIVVAGPDRHTVLSDLPSYDESGIPGLNTTASISIYTMAGVPRPIVQKLNTELNRIVQIPEVRERMAAMSVIPAGGTVEELEAYARAEMKKWRDAVRISGARID